VAGIHAPKRLRRPRNPRWCAFPAALRTNLTRLVAVFIPRLRDEVLALMYEGIEGTLEAAGYQHVVLATGDDPDVQLAKLQIALQRRVDGVLVGDAVIGSPFPARRRASSPSTTPRPSASWASTCATAPAPGRTSSWSGSTTSPSPG
jgi:hypothetical protein